MPDCTGRQHRQIVTPAEAGVQYSETPLDSGFRRNDGPSLGGMFAVQT
jgi:hypothetical protein